MKLEKILLKNLIYVESLGISIQEKTNFSADEVIKYKEYLVEIAKDRENPTDVKWLIDKTEEFCQDKAIYNAVLESISILDGKNKDHTKNAIPGILSDALAVSFDPSVGHDYLDDSDARYDFYHTTERRIPTDLVNFNKITKGGFPAKSLTIAMAGTGVGKSLFMCHMAAAALVQGVDVLYITMEMAAEKIAERIDANLLNVNLDDLVALPKDQYDRKINKIRSMTTGKLKIKEYPTATASVIHFRTLLNELNLKKSFKPQIIFVDYLNICCSARMKLSSNINSYTYVKAIAEELRGLAVELDVPVVSATQLTRAGFGSSDPGLEDTSESFGLPATADIMFALITSEDLDALNQIMLKQLKNRYFDLTKMKRIMIGIDRAKMKLYDVEQSAQHDIVDSGQPNPMQKPNKKDFSSFKV